MSFADPIWLYALPLALLSLTVLFVWAERRSRQRLARFAASKLVEALTASYSRPRQIFKMALVGIAVALFFVAMARPQYGFVLEETEARGLDIMFALDTSRSMLAEDVEPNRLERSKLAILDLLDDLRGDQVGLIAFAGEAFLQAPLTLDHAAFRQTLAVTDTHTILRGGTNIAAAIEEARASLDRRGTEKLLVLISDGEDLGAEGIAAAEAARRDGIRIFTVGVGSSEGGPILIRLPNGDRDYVRDPEGQPVRSALDEQTLRAIAATTDGIYVPLGASSSGLRTILEEVRSLFPELEHGVHVQEIPLERYQWPLAAGILLLLLEPLLGTRRRTVNERPVTWGAIFLISLLSWAPTQSDASPQRALQAYERGNYERAVDLFSAAVEETPNDARLQYNYGNALYRSARYAEAREAFERALKTTDPALQSDAFFNLGNTLFRLGQVDSEDLAGRIARKRLWDQAAEAYANARALDPESEDVARNEALLQRALLAITAQLTVTTNPAGAGTARPASGRQVRGDTIELEARAQDGWLFRRWEGGNPAEPDKARTRLVLENDTEVIAQFVKTWQLEVISANPEEGSAGESGRYPADEAVTITAEAKDGYAFKQWEATDGATIAEPRAPQTQVTLAADATVTAHFQDAFHLAVAQNDPLGGTAGETGWYPINSDVPIQAEPREGFSWMGWTGQGVADPTAVETTVTLDRNRKVTAHFQRDWNLIVYPQPEEGGTTSGSSPEPVGTTVTISATPSEGYTFERWEGPGVADPFAAETVVTIESQSHDVAAIFKAEENEDENQDQDQNQDQNPDQDEDSEQNPDEGENSDSEESDPNQDRESDDSEASDEEASSNPGQPEEQEADSEESDEQEGETEPLRAEGQMTEEEAKQLLNVLRETEQKLPARRRPVTDDPSTERDW